MYEKHTKRHITKKAIFVFAGILIAFAVLVTGIILITNKKDLDDTLVTLPFSDSDSYVTVGNNIVYIEEGLLKVPKCIAIRSLADTSSVFRTRTDIKKK